MICASLAHVATMTCLWQLLQLFAATLPALGRESLALVGVFAQVVLFLGPLAPALGVYHILRPRMRLSDRNTWCGRCGYLLKGLVEPRCPECGTQI